MEKKHPKVGVGVMIKRGNNVLLGLRKGSHGAGEWSFPGGSVEWGETVFETAKREAMEECGLKIDNLKLISVGDEMKYIDSDGKHFIVLGVLTESTEGEVETREPDRISEWKWFSLDSLPKDMFEGTRILLKNYKTGTIYTEVKYQKK